MVGISGAPDEDVVFINLGFRSAERLRDALDVALKMREQLGGPSAMSGRRDRLGLGN